MFATCVMSTAAIADDEDDEEPRLLPGLVAHYQASPSECARRDDAVQFVWNGQAPDERLPRGGFSVEWRGRLQVLSPGEHRFYLFAAGDVSLGVAGKRIVSGQSQAPRWFDSPAIELEFGHHPIAIRFKKTSDQARVGLYWSGPQFELEPVPGRLLFHEPSDDPGDVFERGAELWRALRCANCHHGAAGVGGLAGPSLVHLRSNMSRAWLVAWLRRGSRTSEHDREALKSTHPSRLPEQEEAFVRMPQFALSDEDAEAVADYVLGAELPGATSRRSTGDAGRGRRLFMTVGCLACHPVGDLGAVGLFGGGDLSHVAEKRPADFFARWLADPAKINPDHRMPVFKLSEVARADLAAWLATLKSEPAELLGSENQTGVRVGSARGASGLRLVEQLRCRACHALPGDAPPRSASVKFDLQKASKHWEKTCLGMPDREGSRPGYALSQPQREALVAYLAGALPTSPPADGRFVLRERNCLACHARDGEQGIAANLAPVVEQHPELAPLLPTLPPPALTAVGDKLHDAALADAITLRNPPLRPWLAVRMPKFNLSEGELAALTAYFTTIDRIPDRPRSGPKLAEKALASAGSRLVTSAGFGCTSCHKIGSLAPSNVALAARGTDLSLVGNRIRGAWFDRWVRNPARIVPRMEMPAIQIPVRGVLGGKLDSQLAAVWHVLNTPGFEPPPSGPIRVARHSGDDSPPIFITDVVEVEKRVIVRPVMIGLKNRHNVLFDLGANQLVGWWLGDTANQQTRGKSWYWEPAGPSLFPPSANVPEIELLSESGVVGAIPAVGSAQAELDSLAVKDDAVAFRYRLMFAGGSETIVLRVTQTIFPVSDGRANGLRRHWEVDGVPAGYRVRLHYLPNFAPGAIDNHALIRTPPGAAGVNGSRFVALSHADEAAPLAAEVVYLSSAVPPGAPLAPPTAMPEAPVRLNVVPGYDAVRLPLPRSEMPTGLAWRDDGALFFCSLKGGVWLARDTDADGIEDRVQLVADGLPAPYGIACRGETIDVAAKYGLVRLSQFDNDGRARRAEVVASGWGYTDDYHDWTIGLPRDADGNYYIGLPCQQDNRTPAEAYLRGGVVRLRATKATVDRPRLFDLEPISAGIRFPMGLAIDRDGELFATDNQGNYNPFNELNHLRQGARYGFINKLEVKPGFQPPFEEPAIAIPHPWTRSVNGICFLYTPETVHKASDGSAFGPFEGQLIGCEFDTRRLIRMSLERIGGTYQGAAYPFSIEPAPGEPTFEGPVVCAVSPEGDLYVGNLRDSGWGGGQNTGSIVRLRPNGSVPVGIAEVRALHDGFAIDFTAPVDGGRAADASNYSVSSYRRITTPAYGGPDVDRESEPIVTVELSADGRRASLRLKRLRAGFVYEFQLKNLAGDNQKFFPAEAHYTLRMAPE
ncbi:MAG TPA: c-type cytochrome [Pirellulales bacterium]|nr:c-type cytochrome [Pirellulales bacterium]